MGRIPAIVLAVAFAAFVVATGIPTLRHDWNWPVDRFGIVPFLGQSTSGWLPVGFGIANPHPTTYLLALPLVAVMSIFGTLAGLAILALATGYCCATGATDLAARWGCPWAASLGVVAFATFNPWVYNEVVAGHLIMVLAYGGLLGLLAEMARGQRASPVRLALWLVLVEAQLQFFIVAMAALIAFALTTKKWLPVAAGTIVALPSIVGLVAERGSLLRTPYSIAWQANQSVAPLPLLSLGGYFAGYADRLGIAAHIAVWTIVALALAGVVLAYRRRAVLWAAAAAVLVYLLALGLLGPLAAPYEWIVRQVPESGVFRELYDLAGILAALLALLACAGSARVKALGYLALGAGAILPITWLLSPPSSFWISSRDYPRAEVSAPPFSRVALLPAFQPLQLRRGGGDGADPDSFVYPQHVAALNAYFPTYPVDMALARYTQYGDAAALRALGVAQIVDRPWLVSRTNGGVGLAASSMGTPSSNLPKARDLTGIAPLISQCNRARIVASVDRIGACDLFFGDAPGFAPVVAFAAQSDSIDASAAWIDARLAFARAPALAQALGGTLTQSHLPHSVQPGTWLLAYVRGRLSAPDGRVLVASRGAFSWAFIPPDVATVVCAGLCELAADASSFPAIPPERRELRSRALMFNEWVPWLFRVRPADGATGLLRLNERYDPAWMAISAWRVLPHVRLALSANGWFLGSGASSDVVLVQMSAFLQSIAEFVGLSCVALLLKALVREPTKRN